MRLVAYGLASTGLASAVVVSALKSRPNFFAAAVSVGRSTGALIVLANFALFNAICFGIAFKRVFFGQLRAIEYEHLFERLWIFLTESLLALTIFRDDFSPAFAIMYGVLVFLKCFHWICADRVEYMDQVPAPGPPLAFHVRVITVISLLATFDLFLFTYAAESILIDGVSAMLLFASEFAILLASIAGTGARYIVNTTDIRRARGRVDAPSWEEKSMYMFYIDLAVDFAKLLTYLTFFTVILLNYGLPLHILRDVYMTLRSFASRCSDLVRYRAATRNMDALYPDATEDELAATGDRTCIICREEMVRAERGADGPNETPKKLQCGHVFHFHCLRSWLERQQSCPTCRRDVLTPAAARQGAAPAAPQPGAVPRIPAPNQLDPLVARRAFEEYFRIPAVNGDAPLPQPTPPPAAQVAPATRPGAPADQPAEADRNVQRSIWGGPITPGQFFAQPLGAAPRWPGSTAAAQPNAAAGPSRPRAARDSTSTASIPGEGRASGSVTPFDSQAPVIFSLPARRFADAVDANRENDVRRAAAEAALRRAHPRDLSSAASSRRGSPAVAQHEQVGSPAMSHKPFLSPLELPRPHLSRASLSDLLATRPQTPEGAREALDDRLRLLQGVDHVVRDLVDELSRVRDDWSRQDDEGEP